LDSNIPFATTESGSLVWLGETRVRDLKGSGEEIASEAQMTLETIRPMVLAFFILLPFSAMAQSPSTSPATSDQQLLKPAELDALVAPIALYPDTLLAQVLIASTYPLEVVQAERWATENKNLKGDQLKTQVDKQAWDESLKSLVATPSVLTMMSTKLDWTQKLGDAVLAQQPDVMDAIQRLRSRAQANNKLTSTKEQKVSVKQEQSPVREGQSTVGQAQTQQVIAIESTNPETVYVPYYDPAVVYGGWPYPEYPPYDYYPPGYYAGGLLATGLAFGAGYALGHWGANYWGGSINWSGGGNNIQINRGARVEHWQHNPQHRQGVKYKNANVQQKFGNNNLRAGSAARNDFRGRGGQQVLKPGGDRAGLGDRGPGDRAGGGDRGGGLGAAAGAIAGGAAGAIAGGARGDRGDRGAGNRPSAGDRGQTKQAKGGGTKKAKGAGAGAKGPTGGKQAKAGGGGPKGPSGGKQAGGASRPSTGARGGRDSAFGNIGSGRAANLQSQRGRASLGGGGPRMAARGGGGARMGGGGFRGGGGGRGGGGRGGGGRRSDVRLKHDIALLGRFDNSIGLYRFTYNGDVKAYVGVMAQEVQTVVPEAVVRGRDGYLRVFYDKLGLKFQTYDRWIASGAPVPATLHIHH
jgi:Protein of unknown function (DUF3300)